MVTKYHDFLPLQAQKRVPVLKSELEQMLIDQNKTKIGLPAVATNLLAHAQLMKGILMTIYFLIYLFFIHFFSK